MPAALPLWVLAYSLGIWGSAGLGVRWEIARWALTGAILALGLGCLRDRGKGVALLGCALALGGLAQGRRAPVLEIPAIGQRGDRSLAAHPEGELSLTELLASAELLPDTQWLCEGRVSEAAVATEHGAALRVAVTALRRADGPTNFAGLAGPLVEGAVWLRVTPPLLVAVSVRGEPREPLLPGTLVRLVAPLRSPRAAQNPGSPDRLRHASAIGIHALASVDPEVLFPWLGPPTVAEAPAPLHHAYERLLRSAALVRGRLLERIVHALPESAAGPSIAHKSGRAVVAALALGERGLVAQADRERHELGLPTIDQSFRGAGIYHVLSVSGLHLAVVAWIFYRLLAWLLLWVPGLAERWAVHRVAALVALPPTLFYSLLTGAELATQRAAVAALICLGAVGCGRRAALGQALAGAVLAIAFPVALGAGTPALLLCEPALILSLLATAAIAYLQPLGGVPERLQAPAPPALGVHRVRALGLRVLRGAWRLTESSLSATLVTAPVCAWYFSELQLGGVLGNLLPGLLGELVVLPLGLFGSLIGLGARGAGALILSGAITAAAGMVRSAAAIAQLGGVAIVPAPHPLLALLWWLGLGLVAAGRRRGYWATVAALLLYLMLWKLPSRELRVTVLDVGQGDAIVVELPGGGVLVVDAGLASPSGIDMGARVVVPFLRRRGYRRIDVAVASHPHPDHTGGLTALVESFPVGELWVAPTPSGVNPEAARSRRSAPEPSWLHLLQLAAQRGVVITAPHSQRLQGVDVEVLAPCRSGSGKECVVEAHADWQHNDNSVVLRLGYAGRTILLPGDIELAGELAVLDRQDARQDDRQDGRQDDRDPDRASSLHADVLKAAHHCSRTSSSESLVAAVQPQWVICSVGAYNRYRFPHAEVTARYQAIGSRVLRTDADGAAEIKIDAAGALRVTTQATAQ